MEIKNSKLMWLTALQMAIAVVIAFVLDYRFSLRQGYWAVITIAVVVQPTFSPTLTKGIMRIIGTLVGAVLGWGIAHMLGVSLFLVMALFFAVLLVTSYLSLIPTIFSYAGIISGVTLVIVLASTMQSGLLLAVAKYRSLEVILGVVIATLVGSLLVIGERLWSGSLVKTANANKSNKGSATVAHANNRLLIKSLVIAAAATLTFLPWAIWRYPEGFWTSISCLLIMEESLHTTCKKGSLRFIAHLLAALYGLLVYIVLLALPWHNHWLLLPPLAVGFFICGAIVGRFYATPYSTLGNTMGVAVAIMLLFGASVEPSLHTILFRFVNVIIGISLGIILANIAE